MKITDVQAYALCVPFRMGDLLASIVSSITQAIVKVTTDEGITSAARLLASVTHRSLLRR